MATGRQIVADRIRADNPEYVVCAYPKTPANVQTGKPFVDVFTTGIEPAQGETALSHTLEVHAYAAQTEGEAAEAAAEDVRDNVLLSLQRIPDLTWTRAERVTFADVYAGYKITVTASSKNVYKQTITNEG